MTSFDQNHPVFSAAYTKYQENISNVPLAVIILGPGEKSPGYEKRVKVKKHLQESSSLYDVAFVEDLPSVETGLAGFDSMEKIAFCLANADIVFALTIDDQYVTGVLAEIAHFRINKQFIDKTHVIVPSARAKRKKSSRIPLIWESLQMFPEYQRCEYSPDELRDCTMIRDWVAARADKCRKRMAYRKFLEDRGIMPPRPY